MKKNIFILFLLLLLLASCHSSKNTSYMGYDFRTIAKAGIALGMDVEQEDNIKLMVNASTWIGTPYRYGGNDRRGIDCSGLSKALYRDVYGIELDRVSRDQYKNNCKKIGKKHVAQGDLLFFTTDSSKGEIGHVGVYLKNGKFVHASTSKGVVISKLDEAYYVKHWYGAGKVKQ
ncbi:MAG: C40 family peptidase [Prevotellaceae bacterium]|nr:C40 family peptidase [Candidatus Minthosoma caballi]